MSKFHGVLTSCRFKRAQRTAAFPNLWSKANESVSECSRRSHIDEQGAKFMLCNNDIGCDVMKDVEQFLCAKHFHGNFLLLQKNDREE